MGLEYRGERVSEDQDIIRLLDARATAQKVTTQEYAQGLIDSRVEGLASKAYVDSAFDTRATQAEVDAAYANKLPYTDDSVFTLDGAGSIGVDKLPQLYTRGAKWVAGGSVTPRLNVGAPTNWLGLNEIQQLSSLYVNGSSLMGGRPYHMMGFAQIECKGNFAASQPIIYIGTNSGYASNYFSVGYGIPGWRDYYHMNVLPSADSTVSHTGNKTIYLTCRSLYDTADFTDYFSSWGVLLIPIL